MDSPQAPFDMLNVGPEVKSYIYQILAEFEPFTTAQTTVAVIAKDPLRLITRLENEGIEFDRKKLRNMYRISITLMEDGSKLEEEGLHESIFEAIKMAKDKLLKQLTEIQDQIVSSQDRKIQIDSAVGGGHVH